MSANYEFTDPADVAIADDDSDEAASLRHPDAYPFVADAPTQVIASRDAAAAADDEEDVPADVLEARARVEATRAELSGTVDAIKEKLSPHNLVAEAREAAVTGAQTALTTAVDTAKDAAQSVVESVKETAVHVAAVAREKFDDIAGSARSTVADATDGAARTYQNNVRPALSSAGDTLNNVGATIVETIKLNPLPAAVTGIGLAWLIVSIRQQNANNASTLPSAPTSDYVPAVPQSDRFVSLADEYGGYPNNYAIATSPGQPSTLDNVKGTLSDAKDKVAQAATGVAQNVSDAASGAAQSVSSAATNAAHVVGDKATALGGQMKDYSNRAVGATGDFYQGTPLAAGAIALLFGVAIGLMIPTTDPENRWMGETRDRLKDQAAQQIQDVAGKVQTVANAAIGTAKSAVTQTVQQEAQNRGLVGAAA